MSRKIFITSTDTDMGKTFISVGLLKGFNALGYRTLGVKPIASGCTRRNNILYNDDALALQRASSIHLDLNDINPFAFEPAIAPHIAAARVGVSLSVVNLSEKTKLALAMPADIHIIEGAGGWQVPLNSQQTMADFVVHHEFEVILVVGIRLGCINHAILTYQSIKSAGAKIIGWIANHSINNVMESVEIIDTLKNWLAIPCFGVIDYNGCVEKVAKEIDSQVVLQKAHGKSTLHYRI